MEDLICRHFNVTIDDIMQKRGKGRNIEAKHFLWYMLHYKSGWSLNRISRHYGYTYRNVTSAIAKIRSGISNQPYYRCIYKDLMNEIGEGQY